tara:strand:+ start:1824 stop:2051 length:228 start_codon:yes stop_codon:yes gene_type:complete
MNRKYIILNTSELGGLNFNQLVTTSANTARKNNAGNKAIVSYVGDTPDGLSGKTEYTNSELRVIVDNLESGWCEE